MPRFYLPRECIQNGRFTLSGSEAHHARAVLRKQVGDTIELFDGENLSFTGRIDAIDQDQIAGSILETAIGAKLTFQLTLGQALLKGPKWDWLIEKVCEIGVSHLVPLLTERTLIQPKTAIMIDKLERWNRIALAASKQCGRTDVMRVYEPILFADHLRRLPNEGSHFMPWEKESGRTLAAACAGLKSSSGQIFVGPEGGWATEEIEQAQTAGVQTVKLGPTLLRSETAGIVASTLMLREFHVYG